MRLSALLCLPLAAGVIASTASFAADVTLQPSDVIETKAVFGQVAARDVVPARARIGGTIAELAVTQGSLVKAGQVLAKVDDPKLALQLQAADARISALQSQILNARQESDRAAALTARGDTTQQKLDLARTQVDVLDNQIAAAQADRAVIVRQMSEGEVLAPIDGRVTQAPLTQGAVVMPGDSIVTIAGGGLYLRLALPEREAEALAIGENVAIDGAAAPAQGQIVKIYPQIDAGRVLADVDMSGLGDFFVGQRRRVLVPIAHRQGLLIPAAAVTTRSGLDFVTLREGAAQRTVAVVLGARPDGPAGDKVEALSGLRAGDVVVTP